MLGYVEYPKQDASGVYFRTEFTGKEGVEAFYNYLLGGTNGTRITEENAVGEVESESTVNPPRYGVNLELSIDARLQTKLFGFMRDLARANGFAGGAAVLLDVESGEMLALTSYPEFDSNVMSEGRDGKAIAGY